MGNAAKKAKTPPNGSHPATELHQAHKEPEDGQRGREEEQTPERSEDLGEDPAPQKERTYYGQRETRCTAGFVGLRKAEGSILTWISPFLRYATLV